MFDRYLIIKNQNEEFLYLYINNYYEFSKDFRTRVNKENNIKNIIREYMKQRNILFRGSKIFLVISGVVISYIILDYTIPKDKNWVADFKPVIKDDDTSEYIDDLIEKRSEIHLKTPFHKG